MFQTILTLFLIARTSSFQAPLGIRHHVTFGRQRLSGRISAVNSPLNSTTTFNFWEDSAAFNFREDPVLFGSSWYSNNEYEDADEDYDDEYMDVDISFLPLNMYALPPKTDYILRKLTQTYIKSGIEGNSKEIDIMEVLQVIDEEYKESIVPLSSTITEFRDLLLFEKSKSSSLDDDHKAIARQIFSKILSFAAMYRLPKELAVMLFGLGQAQASKSLDPGVINELELLMSKFDSDNNGNTWSSVSFPQGLSIRLKREYMLSRKDKYFPVPRSSIFTRSADAVDASDAIRQAQLVKLPPKLIQKKEAVEQFNEIERELIQIQTLGQELPKCDNSLFQDMINFFPRQNKILKRVGKMATSKPMMQLRAMSQAWLISYFVLNIFWYTVGILWRWKNILALEASTVLVQGKCQALKLSLKRFAKAFISTYMGNRSTNLIRITISTALTPYGKKVLEYTEEKLNFEEGTYHAARIVPVFLTLSCFGLWAIIIIADSTFSKSSIGTFAM